MHLLRWHQTLPWLVLHDDLLNLREACDYLVIPLVALDCLTEELIQLCQLREVHIFFGFRVTKAELGQGKLRLQTC